MTGRVYELVARGCGHVVSDEIPSPGSGQVVLRVLTNGICASDLPTWSNHAGPNPLRLGHEPVGEVVAVGQSATVGLGEWVGGRITPSFSDFAIADAEDVVRIPTGLEPTRAIPEPLGCVVDGLRRTPIPPGSTVTVVGLGFMGLIMVQLLRHSGAARVQGVDPRQDAREVAGACGADATFGPDELGSHIRHAPGVARSGADIVVEASGTQAGLDLASEIVRPSGVVSILGYHQGLRTIDMQSWNWKAINVVNAHVRNSAELQTATVAGLDLLAANRIDLDFLVTHRFGLDDVDEAFRMAVAKPPGFIKAVICL